VSRKDDELIEKWREALAGFDAAELAAATRVVARLGAYLDGL
jgi:hypothetical protein